MENTRRPLALIILDGWGYSPRREGNAIALANTPYYDEICTKYPKTLLQAAGTRVGLPEGSTGNSEVGHMNIGAGRVIQTDVTRIDEAIRSGAFFQNQVLLNAYGKARENGGALHLVGLLSNSGVHVSQGHLFALLKMAHNMGLQKVFVHCFLDGKESQARTSDAFIEALEIKMADIGVGKIATICGQYYGMDRDQNWERTARAYTMLVHSEGERAFDGVSAIRGAFLRGINDEFIQPIVLEESPGIPVASVRDGDTVVFFNHRGDRMRQIVKALAVHNAAEFNPIGKPAVTAVTLTEYDKTFPLPVAYRPEEEMNILAEVFAREGITNTRVTETEKYAHVTYFFNNGIEAEMDGEKRILIPSPKVATYESHPEMGSFKVTDKLLRGLENSESDVFIVNLAAADAVAHTGNLDKTIEAVQYVDTCLGGILKKIRETDAVAVITSDHGNCEEMINPATGVLSNSHSANPVPFHLVDPRANGMQLRVGGALEDVAPTILGILGIEKPNEMTGKDLRISNGSM